MKIGIVKILDFFLILSPINGAYGISKAESPIIMPYLGTVESK
jgi:hypothetical protein